MTTNQTLQTVRLAVRPFGLCLLFALLVTGRASAQPPCNNPYDDACAAQLAAYLAQPQPPTSPAGCFEPYQALGVQCFAPHQTSAGQIERVSVDAHVFMFGEGVVHAPGSELAWVILTNFGTEPQAAVVELIVSGQPGAITRHLTLQPKERRDLSLHDLPELQGMATFSTSVYFALPTGHAALVMRPATDPFARVVLPPPTVMTASGR